MLRRSRLVLLLVLLLLTTQSGAVLDAGDSVPRAVSEWLPLLRIDPTLTLVPIGGSACADVRIDDVEGLFGFETVIRFDPSRVHVVDLYPKTRDDQRLRTFLEPQTPGNWYVINAADNAAGTIRMAIFRMAPESGASGSGVLARVCLQGINRGHTGLTFSETATQMLDAYVSSVPFTLKSGGALVGPVQRHRIPMIARGF